MSKFVDNADSLLRNIRATPPAPGYEEVMVPGDPESKAREDRSANGIYLNDAVWRSLTDLCVEMDIEVDL
jgi:LDH2 family malate/lactate/ureidoglycolate dehydrogenase